jgi:RimJ/RimL family protein N-acetyltransferase
MLELDKQDYAHVLPLMKSLEYETVFAYAILENIQPGKVYVDRKVSPSCSLVISKGGRYLLVGNADNEEFLSDVVGYLQNKQNHSNYYDLYTSSVKLLNRISDNLVGQSILLNRSSFTFNESKFQLLKNRSEELPERFVMKRMDSTLLEKYQSEIDPSYGLLWTSAEEFIAKGFGYSILTDGHFASVCNSFYIGGGFADIDIITIEKHRRHGLGTSTCTAFIQHCLENNLVPVWDCDAGNELSIQLATKLGFEKNKDFPMLWWHENKEVITNYLKEYNYLNHPIE